jgi:hypothetical protein
VDIWRNYQRPGRQTTAEAVTSTSSPSSMKAGDYLLGSAQSRASCAVTLSGKESGRRRRYSVQFRATGSPAPPDRKCNCPSDSHDSPLQVLLSRSDFSFPQAEITESSAPGRVPSMPVELSGLDAVYSPSPSRSPFRPRCTRRDSVRDSSPE